MDGNEWAWVVNVAPAAAAAAVWAERTCEVAGDAAKILVKFLSSLSFFFRPTDLN